MKQLLVELILFVLFIIFSAFGFFIINKQVSLVKKGEFNIKDRIISILYGIIFSLSIMVVVAMAVIFTIETPEFWTNPSIEPPEIHPIALLLPFIICMLYLSFYPLVDFLFIAIRGRESEGLTIFHKFLSKKIINISKNKFVSILMAIILYLIFLIPPFLISFLNIPFMVIWISWILVYPITILTFFGSKGYIAGISNVYYHIPEIKRYSFLNFEDSKRGIKQFLSNPSPYIIFGMMLFVFVWAWISLFQTIGLFFTGSLAISTMTSVFVFVTLFFGVIGYFTRFWGRKIKYRGIDIYFSAYLMASIGINVLVNFLIVNSDKLVEVFNFWTFTNQIIPNYRILSWAAVIEEITMLIFTIYFFVSRKSDFIQNLKVSKITQCGQTFDPIPLFNFVKNKNSKISEFAEKTLVLMFERIAIRSEINLDNWKYKNILLDGLSDPNQTMRKVCFHILNKLSQDSPNLILPWLLEALESPNYVKSLQISKILLNLNNEILNKIPREKIFNLIKDSEWRFKFTGLKYLLKIKLLKKELIQPDEILNLIDDPDNQIQVEILSTLYDTPYEFPKDILFKKINHPNMQIRAQAINNLASINTKSIDSNLIQQLIPFMKDPSSSVRASIFNIFSNIDNFKKYSINAMPFIDALNDKDKSVRDASILVLKKYFDENPKDLNLDIIINKIDKNNPEITESILTLLGALWERNAEKILSIFLTFIKFENREVRETVSNLLIEKYDESPNLVFENLIMIQDDSKFISKGIISKTIIKIAKKHPDEIYTRLINSLNAENVTIKLNSLNSLDGMIDITKTEININLLLNAFQNESNNEVKKYILQLLSKIAKISPNSFIAVIDNLIDIMGKQESFLKITLIKIIMIITEKTPDVIPLNPFLEMLSDNDPFIRETTVKIMGYIGYKSPSDVCSVLINKTLNDEEWNVREASILSIGKIINLIDNKQQIIKKLVNLLDDKNSWVRRSSMNLLSSLKDLKSSEIPIEKLLNNITNKDPIVRERSASLLEIYGFDDIIKLFDYIIKLLGDISEEVRRSTVNVMVKIIKKIGLTKILSKLLKNLSDETSIETQQSIALIFGRTVKYEDEEIKKRVISLLKVRCEMSQDPIICETLTKLKES